MASDPKFCIGIDLGTTNCALSYVELGAGEGAVSQVLPIAQLEERHTVVERDTLPSFLYWPGFPATSEAIGFSGDWIVGLHARQQAAAAPDRVAHSAKSWLAHHAVGPGSRILPWKSESVPDQNKLSPIEASACLLGYLKDTWDRAFAGRGESCQFARQRVVITVPASFDVASQNATREAARLAGFPEDVRLLEEPQAAFYRWLEASGESSLASGGGCILVVDIGGGTSDFSLFQIEAKGDDHLPRIKRIAVSDHVLLGGDNIDLALSHALESELAGSGGELSVDQWGHLIAQARAAKERCLSEASGSETLRVAVPSKGSGLLAGSLSAEVDTEQVRALLLEGFFPLCPKDATPEKSAGGLVEWGLPYAQDCAVTRHLAAFLHGAPRVDAILFNGGTLASPLLRERLLEQVATWQDGAAPIALENPETDLAVARGAASYASLLTRSRRRIEAGLARSVYIEVAAQGAEAESSLVCLLPRGAQSGERHRVELEGLSLAVNRLVRFQVYQGSNDDDAEAGQIRNLDTEGFVKLPALETRVDVASSSDAVSIPVALEASVNELGLLELFCVDLEERSDSGRWRLAFSLRAESPDSLASEGPTGPALSVSEKDLAKAESRLKSGLSGGKPKASRIFRELESALGLGKAEWDLALSRKLGDKALACETALEKREDGREAWLMVTGYLLRPGFGALGDDARLDRIWGLALSEKARSKRLEAPGLVFWRRLAGGLESTRQEALFDQHWEQLQASKRAVAERVRLLGALERVDAKKKQNLVDWCIETALTEAKSGGYVSPYLASLGQLLSRMPLRSGPEGVLPPSAVIDCFERLGKLDWKGAAKPELAELFLKAARVTDDRALDLPSRAAKKIRAKLESAGVPPTRLIVLQEFRPPTQAERASVYGESLPAGLSLG